VLADQLADGGYQISGDRHHRVRSRLERGLIFCDGFFVGLGFVMLENPTHACFVPARRIAVGKAVSSTGHALPPDHGRGERALVVGTLKVEDPLPSVRELGRTFA
jgi:hypothetical protein